MTDSRLLVRVPCRTLVSAALMAFILFPARASIRYVDMSAPPNGDGTSWDRAWRSLGSAIDGAASGDEIWVARGTYVGAITISKPLGLYGGFAGVETDRSVRNVKSNRTVIDADGGVGVTILAGTTAPGVFDGFTIRNGRKGMRLANTGYSVTNTLFLGNDVGLETGSVGSILIQNTFAGNGVGLDAVSFGGIVQACVFYGNDTGVMTGVVPRYYHNTFVRNTVGIQASYMPQQLVNTVFAWNQTGLAVATVTTAGPKSCVFWSNAANVTGLLDPIGTNGNIEADPLFEAPAAGNLHITEGSPCKDAGLALTAQSTWLDIDGGARLQGSAADIGADEYDGASHLLPPATVRVDSSKGAAFGDGSTWATAKRGIQDAVESLWERGGEVWVAGGPYRETVILANAVGLFGGFAGDENNRSARHGQATVLAGSPSRVTLRSPLEPARLDGIFIRNAETGIECLMGSPAVTNSVVAGCLEGVAVRGGQPSFVNLSIIANGHGMVLEGGTATVVNTLIAYNDLGIHKSAASPSPAIRHSCLYGNRLPAWGLVFTPGFDGNITADPRIASLDQGDVHLQPNSPCRDTGDPSTAPDGPDIDGQSRVQGSIDIGADEADGEVCTPVLPVSYVNAASPGGDGSSWSDAFATLDAAMTAASVSGGEVRVAGGTYTGGFTLPAFTRLYGGYRGSGDQPDDRDARAFETVVNAGPHEAGISISAGHTTPIVDGLTVRGGLDGIFAESSSPLVSNVILHDNATGFRSIDGASVVENILASSNLTGLAFEGGAPRVNQVRLLNQAQVGMAAWNTSVIVCNSLVAGSGQTGVALTDTRASLVQNTIAANRDGIILSGGTLDLRGNIVAHNHRGGTNIVDAWMGAAANCFFGNSTGFTGLTDPTGTMGNIASDPMFVAAEYGDFHIQPASPCRDVLASTGPGEDIDGEPRLQGALMDIGADESDGVARTAVPVVVRVSASGGSDANDGSSWTAAKTTLQSAIDAAALQGGEVWVGQGTYAGPVTVRPFTYVYGGFSGTEAAREEPRPSLYPSIVEGGIMPTTVKLRGGQTFGTLNGITVDGGTSGISVIGTSVLLTDNTVQNATKAGMSITDSASRVIGNRIHGNGADNGWGVALERSEAVLRNNIIWQNGRLPSVTPTTQGGLSINGGAPRIEGNLLAKNVVSMNLTESLASVINNTIVDNTYGPRYSVKAADVEPLFANNLIAHNISNGMYRATSAQPVEPRFFSNLVYPETYSGLPIQTGQNGNISANPLFVNRIAGVYRVLAGSPAIDAGSNDHVPAGLLSMDGRPRVLDGTVDIGAYEFAPPIFTVTDAATALRAAAGLIDLTAEEYQRLNAILTGDSAAHLDVVDALAIVRNATGTD